MLEVDWGTDWNKGIGLVHANPYINIRWHVIRRDWKDGIKLIFEATLKGMRSRRRPIMECEGEH